MGKGKRKSQDTKAVEQLKDPDTGLVTDTDYHTGGSQARTFQQIYEFYKSDAEPENREDAETWQKDSAMGKGKRKAQDTKAVEQLKDPDVGLVTDTDYHTGGSQARSFQQIYEFYKSDAEPENIKEAETWQKVKRIGIHLIVARLAILPWHNMTRWILSKCCAKGVISKVDGSNLVSFTSENVTSIYALPKPELIADETYMKAFDVKNPDINDWLQEWWHDENEFKPSSLRTCRVQDFHEYYKPVAVMICRLMGENTHNLFRKEWVPIMHAVVEEGKILNWACLG